MHVERQRGDRARRALREKGRLHGEEEVAEDVDGADARQQLALR